MRHALTLFEDDLRIEYTHLECSDTAFEHFSDEAQEAIRVTGGASYEVWRNGVKISYNAIHPPKEEPDEPERHYSVHPKNLVLNYDGCPYCHTRFCVTCVDPFEFDTENKLQVKLYQEKKDLAEKVESAISMIIGELNCSGGDRENIIYNAIALGIAKSHRTLQQVGANVLLRAIVDYFAMCDGNQNLSDGRNEAAAALGTKLKEIMDENPLPQI